MQGDVDGAIALLRRGANLGDENAAGRLVELLARQGDVEGLRERADAGDEKASYQMAHLLARQGDLNGLRLEVLRGNPASARLLSNLLTASDSHAAERLVRNGLSPDEPSHDDFSAIIGPHEKTVTPLLE
jgi:hypothetical protein